MAVSPKQNATNYMDSWFRYYQFAIEELGDSRTKNWFMVYSPWVPFAAMLLYTIFCAKANFLMKGREPFKLSKVLPIYNLAQVCFSAYMFYEFLMSSYLANYTYIACEPTDYSTSPLAMRMAKVCWLFYISKYLETFDTLFFVLRKKFNQITFLHVYHHSSMIFNSWLAAKYVPGGGSFFNGMVNCLVHVFMYSYYGLSSFGPAVQKYLWWKKYLTQLQIAQFFLMLSHATLTYFDPCDYPKWLNLWTVLYMVSLILLFGKFYLKSYDTKVRRKQE